MGGGASKNKGKQGVAVASTIQAAPKEDTEEKTAPSSPPKPSPEKPKETQEVKRPRPVAKGSRGSGSKESLDGETPRKNRPPLPPGGPRSSPAKAEDDDEEDDVEVAEAKAMQRAAEAAQAVAAASSAEAPPDQQAPAPEEAPAQEVAPSVVRDISPEELIEACRCGDAATVQSFMSMKASTSKGMAACEEALFDVYGDSVLHHSVHGGSEEVLRMLLDVGRVPADIPNARNETALQLACRRGDPVLVNTLLRAEANPERTDAAGLTPLLSGIFSGAPEVLLDMLVRAKANVSAQDNRGVGAVHFGALRGDAALIVWLLRCGCEVDAQTEHGTTALMLAAKRGQEECVSLLLEGRASMALADQADCTALMQALSSGNVAVAQFMLERGASVDLVDGAGRGALFHAVLGGNVAGINSVVARGGRVNMLDEEGRSPLYQACLMSGGELVTCLLEAGADPNLAAPHVRGWGRGRSQPSDGAEGDEKETDAARACLEEARTCLQVCATLAHNDLITRMLEHGADVNAAPGGLGWTSLHLCAAVGNEEGACILLARGATTSLVDAEGNTALVLAERAGQQAVLERLREAAAAEPEVAPEAAASPANRRSPVARRSAAPGPGGLPPLHAGPGSEQPEEELEPLVVYREEWVERDQDGSLLDRALGPLVHDALRSDQWINRWEALTHLSNAFADRVAGDPKEVVLTVGELLNIAARDKVPKVFLASLAVFEEFLSDARVDALSPEEFTSLLRGRGSVEGGGVSAEGPASGACDALMVLLNMTDVGGSVCSSAAASPPQAAMDALCSCVLHGRVPLDELAWPLLGRVDERLRGEAAAKERKDEKKGKLAANLRLLGRWLSAFGLQQSGLFRRSLVLPLLLRGVASESSRTRAAAGDALVQLMSLSGGLEERLWALLPSKSRKAVQRLAKEHAGGVTLTSAAPCEEDAMQRHVIVAEDARANGFVCVADLNKKVWASLQAGESVVPDVSASGAGERIPATSGTGSSGKVLSAPAVGPGANNSVANDGAAAELRKAFASKKWQERAESLAALAAELAAAGDGVRVLEEAADDGGAGGGGGPLLSQYVLRGHRISTLQASLETLLADSVTAVFVAATDLLRLACSHVPLYIAPLFLEPLLPPLVARLVDTSQKVRSKAVETALEVAMLHGCALSEMTAQCVASGSAWSAAPAASDGAGGARDCDRSAGPRLQLLVRLVQQVHDQDSAGRWTDETWKTIADCATRSAEHRNGDVRKEAASLLNGLTAVGGRAAEVAERAVAHLQAMVQQKTGKRPGTGSTRQGTGLTRLATPSTRQNTGVTRQGTAAGLGASGRISNLGSTGQSGFTLNMGSTGRLSTATRSKTGCTGSSFRPRTGSSIAGSLGGSLRPGTGLLGGRDIGEESDNSIHSEPEEPEVPASPAGPNAEPEDGVKFFNVKTACPGADELPDLAEGEQAMREALPLAEALDEIALDFVAPLVALFGDGWTRCFYSRRWQCRVAALTHLASSMSHRLEEFAGPEASPSALAELLDGSMRAVHEGLGDQNVRVYTEACVGVTAVVPAFCGAVDGRLLVAHLAPLLRQLCSRMGDSKEVVRSQTVLAMFRLLLPPTGNIVSPLAMAMLILRHLVPPKDESAKENEPTQSVKNGTNSSKGSATGWLCRLAALRDLAKEHSKAMVHSPGSAHPGEWLRLAEGLGHTDPTVRYEAARLYALICKLTLRSVGDETAQMPHREAWLHALPRETPAKSMTQVRKLLKLPDQEEGAEGAQPESKAQLHRSGGGFAMSAIAPPPAWEVPKNLVVWAGCKAELLAPLRCPEKGEEKPVLSALKALGKAVCTPELSAQQKCMAPEEAFTCLCRAAQQALASPTGADRKVFLCAVDLCQAAVTHLAPSLSGLDVNMGLSKTFPTLMERTSQAGTSDVKIGVASDKLVQQLAKHPKVGCEAVTKMVISAIARTEHPIRPLMMLSVLLSDYGLRLCAQRDVGMLLLGACGTQLERLSQAGPTTGVADDSLRTQIVGVLATLNQFSPETVHFCMSEVDPSHRKLLLGALQEAPNPRLVALGATAAEQESAEADHVAGSAVRAASRSRGLSPRPGGSSGGEGGGGGRNSESSPLQRRPGALPIGEKRRDRESRQGLPRGDDRGLGSSGSMQRLEGAAASPALRGASPRGERRHRRHRGSDEAPDRSPNPASASPPADHSRDATPSRPPAPMGLSTALSRNGDGNVSYSFQGEGGAGSEDPGRMRRVGSSEGRFMKSKENASNDSSLNAIMGVLSQIEGRGKTR